MNKIKLTVYLLTIFFFGHSQDFDQSFFQKGTFEEFKPFSAETFLNRYSDDMDPRTEHFMGDTLVNILHCKFMPITDKSTGVVSHNVYSYKNHLRYEPGGKGFNGHRKTSTIMVDFGNGFYLDARYQLGIHLLKHYNLYENVNEFLIGNKIRKGIYYIYKVNNDKQKKLVSFTTIPVFKKYYSLNKDGFSSENRNWVMCSNSYIENKFTSYLRWGKKEYKVNPIKYKTQSFNGSFTFYNHKKITLNDDSFSYSEYNKDISVVRNKKNITVYKNKKIFCQVFKRDEKIWVIDEKINGYFIEKKNGVITMYQLDKGIKSAIRKFKIIK